MTHFRFAFIIHFIPLFPFYHCFIYHLMVAVLLFFACPLMLLKFFVLYLNYLLKVLILSLKKCLGAYSTIGENFFFH